MNSKKLEEVRKRRAKASPSRLNLYQKMVLVAGILTLLFLAIGLSLQWAPFVAAGVAVGTLLIFLTFKDLRAKKERKNEPASQETLPEGEGALEPEPISSRTDAERTADSPEVISEQINPDPLQDSISPRSEGAFTTLETLPAGKEDLGPRRKFSGDEVLAQIQERSARREEKVINLEEMLLSLEGKTAEMQQTQLESDPKIDLQATLQASLTNVD